jgi:hypothetical protein
MKTSTEKKWRQQEEPICVSDGRNGVSVEFVPPLDLTEEDIQKINQNCGSQQIECPKNLNSNFPNTKRSEHDGRELARYRTNDTRGFAGDLPRCVFTIGDRIAQQQNQKQDDATTIALSGLVGGFFALIAIFLLYLRYRHRDQFKSRNHNISGLPHSFEKTNTQPQQLADPLLRADESDSLTNGA